MIQEIYEFNRSVDIQGGKQRVSEYQYAGTVDDKGNFKLRGCFGRIYPAQAIGTCNHNNRKEMAEMSVKSQQANMKAIHSLVSEDLGYIYGAKESGPNGNKALFHRKGKALLRALGNDLGLREFKVTSNHGGIAVAGEITLMGLWSDGNGVYVQLFQSLSGRHDFLYRCISHMKDYSSGPNQWLPYEMFRDGEYEQVRDMLLSLRKLSVAETDTRVVLRRAA